MARYWHDLTNSLLAIGWLNIFAYKLQKFMV